MSIRSMNGLNRLVGNVRRAALLCDQTALPDGRLLDAFLTHGDNAAFAMLVKRHGPMVLGVCTRVIGNVHDAEDAFQAVFLVLAKRGASIVPRDLVGNWLYGVAYRTALQARGRLVRHRARERQVTDMPQKAVAPDIDLDALHQALDGEVDRLPEKYRVPVVLCDLEGRSRKEVAAILKIPEGTLSSRLAKGRELLAHRLARHGLVLSGSMLATVLANQASAVQPALVGSAVQVATSGVVSAQVLALSEGVMKTMFLSKLKVISILALGIVLGSLGAGLLGKPDSLTPAVHAAQPGATQAGQAKSRPETPEPLDGALLLDQQVQKELRLSKNQVQRIQAISQDVDAKSEAKQKEIKELQKQIDDLHKRIEELNGSMSKNRRQIEEQRAQSIGKAAPDILSEKGVTRLRQIQRQQRHLGELLADASMQRMLRIDDEQLKKIESIRKTESTAVLAIAESLDGTNFGLPYRLNRASGAYLWSPSSGKEVLSARVRLWDQTHNWNTPNLQKLFDVLTPAQQTSLSDWLGEPYPGTSWHALKTETKKR